MGILNKLTLFAIALSLVACQTAKKNPIDAALVASKELPNEVIETPYGKYNVIVDHPKGEGPFPLLVIAPAKKYTKSGEIFARLAQQAKDLGYFVVRFDWSFVTANIEPSKNLADEVKDLENVLTHYRVHTLVDSKTVIVAGKSFGSRVVAKAPIGQWETDAVLLITPNCNNARFKDNYKNLMKFDGNIHIVISINDPFCFSNQIYDSLNMFVRQPTILTVRGDHNFKTNDDKSPRNEATAITSMVNWLALQQQ